MYPPEGDLTQLHCNKNLTTLIIITSVLALLIPTAHAASYQVTLRALDGDGRPINYPVTFIGSFGTVTSMTPAVVSITLPGGTYNVTVYMFGIKVAQANFTVATTLDQPISCTVYSLTAGLYGSSPPGGWYAAARVGQASINSTVRDANTVIFPQLPSAAIKVTAYSNTTGQPIAFGAIDLTIDNIIQLSPGNLFDLPITVQDFNLVPVSNATVVLNGVDVNATGSNGVATFFVQQGVTEEVNVTFLGVPVYLTDISPTPGISVVLNVTVIKPFNVLLIDENGNPIANQRIIMRIGKTLTLSPMTDSAGYLRIPQLPQAEGTKLSMQTSQGTLPLNVTLPLAATNTTLTMYNHPLVVTVEPVSAYMLGFFTFQVSVRVGRTVIKNAVISVGKQPPVTSQYQPVMFQIPVGLDPNPAVRFNVTVYGKTIPETATLSASPVILLMLPFAFLPVVVWRMMVARYKSRRVPLA